MAPGPIGPITRSRLPGGAGEFITGPLWGRAGLLAAGMGVHLTGKCENLIMELQSNMVSRFNGASFNLMI